MTTFEYIILGGLAFVIFAAALSLTICFVYYCFSEKQIEEAARRAKISARKALFKARAKHEITREEYAFYSDLLDKIKFD